jgi:hypothetical protein
VADDVRIERVTKPGEGVERFEAMEKKGFVKVGILSGTGEHPNADHGQTMAEIAWWNEFGTKTIPERPFLRTGLRENISTYQGLIGPILKKILTGKLTADQGLGILGERAKRDVVNKIVMISNPPNSPLTIRAKRGSTSPLIDTGALRQHISWAKLGD